MFHNNLYKLSPRQVILEKNLPLFVIFFYPASMVMAARHIYLNWKHVRKNGHIYYIIWKIQKILFSFRKCVSWGGTIMMAIQ